MSMEKTFKDYIINVIEEKYETQNMLLAVKSFVDYCVSGDSKD